MRVNVDSFSSRRRESNAICSFYTNMNFSIITDAASQEYIFWADSGQVVCVPDAASFAETILPKHFKHNNWQSFVRQLNCKFL